MATRSRSARWTCGMAIGGPLRPCAGPEPIERLVVKPIDDVRAGEGNLDYVISQSTEGVGTITLVYKETANVDASAINVERKVNSIRGSLPQDVQQPTIVRADVN